MIMKSDTRIEKRQEAIKKLIGSHTISDQQTLVRLLKLNYDIDTTQAVVSRDLHQLGVSKQHVGNTLAYELKSIDTTKEILRLGIIYIKYNEVLIVIKTLPALAAFVADYLDAHHEKLNILGTIAGENTIFITPKSSKKIKNLYINICKLLHIKYIRNLYET